MLWTAPKVEIEKHALSYVINTACCHGYLSWWCHQMETFSASLAICAGNSPVTGEFPTQRPVMLSFDVFFDLHLNKRLSKQSWGWWFETPSRSLWCQGNEFVRLVCRWSSCQAVWPSDWLAGLNQSIFPDLFQIWNQENNYNQRN